MKTLSKIIALFLIVPCLFSCKSDDEQPDLSAERSILAGEYIGKVNFHPESVLGDDYTNYNTEVRLESAPGNTLALYTSEQGHLSDKEIFSNFKYTGTDKKIITSDIKGFVFEIPEQNEVKYLVQWLSTIYPIISDVKITVKKSTATYYTEQKELLFTCAVSAAYKAKTSDDGKATDQNVDFSFTYTVIKK
ncbi:MAG: hypothetical protein LBS54_08430 [Dysgonamonadaceae bacterium]|jgi:hypothetical protein|nr:hypothetical protein [Dysgonamonadaceae bacterium]